ncbi:MAG: FtsX-like permease family protein [Methanobacteriota archaeon]|nr:MAG: FtsX-like permease family protein [Euryarchaeota archaeon]
MDTDLTLLILVTGTCLAVLGWAGRKRFPLRIGVGNFFRRKTQVAIVVAGLLIGTAIITSSFVIQTTFDSTIRSAVIRALDFVDETIFVTSPDGSRQPFNMSVYDTLAASLPSMPDVAAFAPRIQFGGGVIDRSSRLFDPTVALIGFDAGKDLGSFVRMDGTAWSGSGLGSNEAIINTKLAQAVEAKAGDGLTLNFGGPQGPIAISVTVFAVVKDEGRGAWNDGENLFLPLDAFQAALGNPGQINTIHVANEGGMNLGYLHSDAAVAEINSHLPATPSFTVAKAKADSVKGATEGVDRLSQVFILLSFFTIVAGVLLIVNIFVMLAEERKGEMGVARALGMRRKNLVQSFVAEGLLYALLRRDRLRDQLDLVRPAHRIHDRIPDHDGHDWNRVLSRLQVEHRAGHPGHPGTDPAWIDAPSGRHRGGVGGFGRHWDRPLPRDPESDSAGRGSVRTRRRTRGPHDAPHVPATRLHGGRPPHARLAPESLEVLQHRERGHHPVHHRRPAAHPRGAPNRPVQQRHDPRGRHTACPGPDVAAGRPHRNRVSHEQEVPNRCDPSEHRPGHVHDRDDVRDSGDGELVDLDDERPRERRLRTPGGVPRPDPELGHGLRRLSDGHRFHERHREPRDRPGARPNRHERELLRSPIQQLLDRRAVGLDTAAPAPGTGLSVP